MDNKLMMMRAKARYEYELLPSFLREKVDKLHPPRMSFKSKEDELEWLKDRLSCLGSTWMGMYCGSALIIGGVLASVLWLILKMIDFIKGGM